MPLQYPSMFFVYNLATNLFKCMPAINHVQIRQSSKEIEDSKNSKDGKDKETPPMCTKGQRPRHLICFRSWTSKMVIDILISALNLKTRVGDTHNKKIEGILPSSKVMILQERNEPVLKMAVSKAASLLGASDVTISDDINWDLDYNGRIFSDMADIIFVCTKKHMCVQKFANCATVPVLCMMSRTHAPIQALATIMSIMEDYGTLQGVNVSYVGPPHPVLNSYLLLCPMLGANIKFKCSCKVCPVSPLLLDIGTDLASKSYTVTKQSTETCEALYNACVVIAGPTTKKKEKIVEYTLSYDEICKYTCYPWTFYHTCPRGEEVDECLFWSNNARTFNAFKNMIYIAAALMANSVRCYRF